MAMQIPKTIRFNSDSEAPRPESSEEAPVSPSPSPDAQVEGPASFLPDAPEYAPLKGKFQSAEALAKSYLELEKRLGGGAPAEPSATPSASPSQPQAFDITPYEAEYQQKGTLSQESYAKLQQQGYTPEVVDQFIAGREALRDRQLSEVLKDSGLGTMERYQEVARWAQQNVDAKELAQLNAAITGNNLSQVKASLGYLNQRYAQANGQAPNLLQGKLAKGPAVQPYLSNEQVTADMRNPKYKTDPAFREEVARRLQVSDVLNNGKIK